MEFFFSLQVIGADVQPSDLCTRREYARWLVAASGALSRYIFSSFDWHDYLFKY